MRKPTQEQQILSMMKRPIPKKKVSIIKLRMVRERAVLFGTERLREAREAADMVRSIFQYADREILLVVALDATLSPIAMEIAAVGGLCSCHIDTRDIFKYAVLSNAAKVICFHNHPSGNLEASREDSIITEKIMKAGKLLGIELIDHIIIGLNGEYLSFRESGLCPFDQGGEAA